MHITNQTWDTLRDNGLDPIRIGDHNITDSMVIDYLRENFNIIVDVRFSPQVIMKPQWHCNIYKSNDVNYYYKVPSACNSFHEMANVALQFIAKKFNFE